MLSKIFTNLFGFVYFYMFFNLTTIFIEKVVSFTPTTSIAIILYILSIMLSLICCFIVEQYVENQTYKSWDSYGETYIANMILLSIGIMVLLACLVMLIFIPIVIFN